MKQQNLFFGDFFKSERAAIFIAAMASFTIAQAVNTYFGFNGAAANWMETSYCPWVSLSDKSMQNISRPWTLFTYSLQETHILRLFTNLIWFVFFAGIVEHFKGKNGLLALFLINMWALGLAALVLSATVPSAFSGQHYMGIKEITLSIAIAISLNSPKLKVFQFINGGISVWFLTLAYAALSFSSEMNSAVHLWIGGFAVLLGLLYPLLENSLYFKFQNFLTYRLGSMFSNNNFVRHNNSDENELYTMTDISEKKIDELLDKINEKGINSLSKQEREWLKKSGK